MAHTVSWGTALDKGEHMARDAKREDEAMQILDEITAKIAELNNPTNNLDVGVIEHETTTPMCVGCPEYPNECGQCKIDADCSRWHEIPAVKVTILVKRPNY